MIMQEVVIIIRKWQSIPVCLPGKSHGQRSLMGYSQWGHNESAMTEHTHTHTMKHYPALKRKEILAYATAWMYLEDIMLSEISQSVTKRQILYDSTNM